METTPPNISHVTLPARSPPTAAPKGHPRDSGAQGVQDPGYGMRMGPGFTANEMYHESKRIKEERHSYELEDAGIEDAAEPSQGLSQEENRARR